MTEETPLQKALRKLKENKIARERNLPEPHPDMSYKSHDSKKKVSTNGSSNGSATSETPYATFPNNVLPDVPNPDLQQAVRIIREDIKDKQQKLGKPSNDKETPIQKALRIKKENEKKANNVSPIYIQNPLNAYAGDKAEMEKATQKPTQSYISQGYRDEDLTGNRLGFLYNEFLGGVGSAQAGAKDAVLSLGVKTGLTDENVLSDYRREGAPEDRDFYRRWYGANVDKRLENKYRNETITSALGGLFQSVPAIAATLASNGAGTTTMFAQAYDGALSSINETPEGKNLDNNTKTLFAVGVGAAQAALERYGLDKIFHQTGPLSTLIAKQAVKKAAKATNNKVTGDVFSNFLEKEIFDLTGKFAKKGAVVGDAYLNEFLTGGLQEAATIGGEFLVNKATGKSVFEGSNIENSKELIKRALYAANAEGIGGLMLGGGSLLIGKKAETKQKINKLQKIKEQLKNPELREESKELLVGNLIELQHSVDADVELADDKFRSLSEDKKNQFVTAVMQKDKINVALNDPSLSEDIKTELKIKKQSIEQEISSLSDAAPSSLSKASQQIETLNNIAENAAFSQNAEDIVAAKQQIESIFKQPANKIEATDAASVPPEKATQEAAESAMQPANKTEATDAASVPPEKATQGAAESAMQPADKTEATDAASVPPEKATQEVAESAMQPADKIETTDAASVPPEKATQEAAESAMQPADKTEATDAASVPPEKATQEAAESAMQPADKTEATDAASVPPEKATQEAAESAMQPANKTEATDAASVPPEKATQEAAESAMQPANKTEATDAASVPPEKATQEAAESAMQPANKTEATDAASVPPEKATQEAAESAMQPANKTEATDAASVPPEKATQEAAESAMQPANKTEATDAASVPPEKATQGAAESAMQPANKTEATDAASVPPEKATQGAAESAMQPANKTEADGKLPDLTKTSADQDAKIITDGFNPFQPWSALQKTIDKIEHHTVRKLISNIQDGLAKKLQTWRSSKLAIKQIASSYLSSIFGGIARTNADFNAKLQLTGGKNNAFYNMAKTMKALYQLIDNDLESLERIHAVLDPEFYVKTEATDAANKPVITYDQLTKKEKYLYEVIRKGLDEIHFKNYVLGFIDDETFHKYKDNYVPRFYETFELSEQDQQTVNHFQQGNKLLLDQFKERKDAADLSQQSVDNIIKDPVYMMAKRLAQLQINSSVMAYIDHVIENNKNLVYSGHDNKIPANFVQLNGKSYGRLNGKYVASFIADDLRGFRITNNILNGLYDAAKAYDRSLLRQTVKKGLTVYNPFVQLGNFTSNIVFAQLAGIDLPRWGGNFINAVNSLRNQDEDFQTLLKSGLIGVDILSEDLTHKTTHTQSLSQQQNNRRKNLFANIWGGIKNMDKGLMKIYSGNDDAAKINAYQIFKKQGYDDAQAIQKVMDGFQNYATVGKFWDVAAKTPVFGNPFIKFQADLLRITANAAFKKPLSSALFIAGLYLMPQIIKKIGLGDKEETDLEKELRENRPFVPKMSLGPVNIPLVYKTKLGELNLARYITPYYFFDNGEDGVLSSMLERFNPIKTVTKRSNEKDNEDTILFGQDPVLGQLYNVMNDVDFRGKSIKNPDATRFRASGITQADKWYNRSVFLARTWIPNGALLHDAYLNAKYGEDFYGRSRNITQTLINMFVKIQQFDKSDYKELAKKQLIDLTKEYKASEDIKKNVITTFCQNMKKAEQAFKEGKKTYYNYQNTKEKLQNNFNSSIKELDERSKVADKKINAFIKKYKSILEK